MFRLPNDLRVCVWDSKCSKKPWAITVHVASTHTCMMAYPSTPKKVIKSRNCIFIPHSNPDWLHIIFVFLFILWYSAWMCFQMCFCKTASAFDADTIPSQLSHISVCLLFSCLLCTTFLHFYSPHFTFHPSVLRGEGIDIFMKFIFDVQVNFKAFVRLA